MSQVLQSKMVTVQWLTLQNHLSETCVTSESTAIFVSSLLLNETFTSKQVCFIVETGRLTALIIP